LAVGSEDGEQRLGDDGAAAAAAAADAASVGISGQ